MAGKRVGILVFDGVKLLDVAGPSEVFSEANRFGGDYEVTLYSPDGCGVASSTGMRIGVDAAAADTGPLAAGKPAGVKQAQEIGNSTFVLIGIGVVTAIAIGVASGSNGKPVQATPPIAVTTTTI